MVNSGVIEPQWTEEDDKLVLPEHVIGVLFEDVYDSGDDDEYIYWNDLDDSYESLFLTPNS